MLSNAWQKLMSDFSYTLPRLVCEANETRLTMDLLAQEIEGLKITYFRYVLEESKRALSLDKGVRQVMQDKTQLGVNLGLASLTSLFTSLFIKDSASAVAGGLESFNTMARAYDDSYYGVVLGEKISVIRSNRQIVDRETVPWPKIIEILEILTDEAKDGIKMGDLNNIIEKVSQLLI